MSIAANYGDFVCRARNSLGSSVHTIKLVRKSKPDTPTDVLAVKAMSDFVMLRWKENFHGGIPNVTFKVQYRPQGTHKLVSTNTQQSGAKMFQALKAKIFGT